MPGLTSPEDEGILDPDEIEEASTTSDPRRMRRQGWTQCLCCDSEFFKLGVEPMVFHAIRAGPKRGSHQSDHPGCKGCCDIWKTSQLYLMIKQYFDYCFMC